MSVCYHESAGLGHLTAATPMWNARHQSHSQHQKPEQHTGPLAALRHATPALPPQHSFPQQSKAKPGSWRQLDQRLQLQHRPVVFLLVVI
ncbi:hypothetical protein BDW69DRAFT_139436 [Aspergillus filifer]